MAKVFKHWFKWFTWYVFPYPNNWAVCRSKCNTIVNGKRTGYAMDAYYYDDDDYGYNDYDDNDYDPIDDYSDGGYGGNNRGSSKNKDDFGGCTGCLLWGIILYVCLKLFLDLFGSES